MLSLIIPTLNAAHHLPATLAATAGTIIAETLIIDGGSTDGTQDIATSSGARLLTVPGGRGPQLAAGTKAALHPWLLLLHADTRLSPGWQQATTTHITKHPEKAGYFRFTLDSADPRARRLERAVAWRCRVFALPYGDQGLLIHKDLLASAGGIPEIPLMEDVHLIRRLGRRRLQPLAADAITSAAKWDREGYLRRSARNLTCLSLYFAGLPPHVIRRLYG